MTVMSASYDPHTPVDPTRLSQPAIRLEGSGELLREDRRLTEGAAVDRSARPVRPLEKSALELGACTGTSR